MNRIKALRERNGLTQQELADKLESAKSSIAMYERGDRKPSLDVLIKLSDIFNCSIDYLIGRTTFKNPKKDVEKKLYDLDLTDNEYNELIDLIKEGKVPNIQYLFSKNTDKMTLACKICSELDWDYTPSFSEKIDENEGKINHEKVKNILLSLDKNNIVHNSSKIVNVPIIGKISAGQPILATENIEGYLPIDLEIYGIKTSNDLFFLRVSGESMNLIVKNGDYALIHKQDYAEDGDIVVALVNGNNEATLKKYKKLNNQFILLEPVSSDSSIQSITVDLKNTSFKILGKAIGQFGKF